MEGFLGKVCLRFVEVEGRKGIRRMDEQREGFVLFASVLAVGVSKFFA